MIVNSNPLNRCRYLINDRGRSDGSVNVAAKSELDRQQFLSVLHFAGDLMFQLSLAIFPFIFQPEENVHISQQHCSIIWLSYTRPNCKITRQQRKINRSNILTKFFFVEGDTKVPRKMYWLRNWRAWFCVNHKRTIQNTCKQDQDSYDDMQSSIKAAGKDSTEIQMLTRINE